jgi:predicted  nucleic acid-binding Zn-ribbon protein
MAITSAETRLAEFAAEHAAAAEALAVAERDLTAELGRLGAARAALVGHVPAGLVQRYEHLRPRLSGVAVAKLIGGHCSGCNLTFSTSELQRLRALPPDELDECEQCGRLLVH